MVSLGGVCLAAAVAYVVYEVLWYWHHTKGVKGGARFFVPVIGNLVQMIVSPIPFWEAQKRAAVESGQGISRNMLVGRIVLFVTDNDLTKNVFDRPEDFKLYAHPHAKFLLGDDNMIYMDAPDHKKFRRLFITGLFNKSILQSYLPGLNRIMRREVDEWCKRYRDTRTGAPAWQDLQMDLRRLTALCSQESHIGPYLHSQEERNKLSDVFVDLTFGFLCFPVPLPGFAFQRALDARKEIMRTLERVSVEAMDALQKGKEPSCVIDFWCADILNKLRKAEESGIKDTETESYLTPHHMANTLLDFLFAAQDATTSALAWTLDLYCRPQYAKVFDHVRAELADFAALSEDGSPRSFLDDFENLKYTSHVTEAMLRFKPPVPMVPHLALKDTTLGDLPVPKGAMVVPSLVISPGTAEALAAAFDPASANDFDFNRPPFVFGSGQHKCAGRRYAIETIKLFLLTLLDYNVERQYTSATEDIIYLPTLFPGDSIYKVSPKTPAEAAAANQAAQKRPKTPPSPLAEAAAPAM